LTGSLHICSVSTICKSIDVNAWLAQYPTSATRSRAGVIAQLPVGADIVDQWCR
jgi:hypothetical protein